MSYQKCLKYITFLTLVLLVFVCEQTMGSSMDKDATTTLAITSNTDGEDTVSLPDFDGDGTVGVSDFLIFTQVFGSSRGDGKYEVRYDLDADGTIGLSDFFIFIQHFGKEVPPSVVSIPDPNLRLLIETFLSLEPERGGAGRQKARGAPILKTEMAKLKQLQYRFYSHGPSSFSLTQITEDEWDQIHESGIKDLTGIEHATNLHYLYLNDIDLSEADLSPLAGLSKLNYVNLDRTKISDLQPLVGLQLGSASFNSNKISDIAPLLKIMTTSSGRAFQINGVHLYANPLSRESINTHIPALRNMEVTVEFSSLVSSQQIYNDNVFVLPIAENVLTLFASRNWSLADYSTRFYEHFSDAFDFLIFIPNVALYHYQAHQEVYSSIGFSGIYIDVYDNDVKGIGKSSYFRSEYGSAQKLQGVIAFSLITKDVDAFHLPPGVTRSPEPRTELYSGPFLHEVMHRWANFIINPKPHWTWNSANGILGGFDIASLVDHGDARYSANGSVPGYNGFSNGGWAGNYIPYSPIELYLAGLIPPGEVPDLWVAEDGKAVPDKDGFWDGKSFTANRVKTYTIEGIIAEHGPRIPDHTQSQKNFRAAVILLIGKDYPTDTRSLDILSEDVSLMSHAGYDQNDEFYNFYEATGGRATIAMAGLSSLKRQGTAKPLVLPSSYGTPPPIVECEIDHHRLLQPHIH